jgi:hypothetical protein
LIRGWLSSWQDRCNKAAAALLGAFTDCGIDDAGAQDALARAQAFQREVLAGCGLPE